MCRCEKFEHRLPSLGTGILHGTIPRHPSWRKGCTLICTGVISPHLYSFVPKLTSGYCSTVHYRAKSFDRPSHSTSRSVPQGRLWIRFATLAATETCKTRQQPP